MVEPPCGSSEGTSANVSLSKGVGCMSAPVLARDTDRTLQRSPTRMSSLLFAAATAVVASHAAVDSFIAPEPGTGPTDHLARGLATLALLGLAAASFPRLRAGAQAALAAALGALALEGSLLAIGDAQAAGARGKDWTGFLLGPVAVALLALAVRLVWSSRKPGRLRWFRRAAL